MKISWVVLTYNRAEQVAQAMKHNVANAGDKVDELIWVDNGSTDPVADVMRSFDPHITVLHSKNLGVAKGYNRGMALSTSEYIVITGCDMLMPQGWLATFKDYVANVPRTGIACMYHKPLWEVPERRRGGIDWLREKINDREIVHAMPIERRIFSRELLGKIGFLREDFGLYGWEDVEWALRAERICKQEKLLCYVIPNMQPQHLGTEGVGGYDGRDNRNYHAFKAKEANDPRKQEILRWCKQNNYPYYNPFAMPTDETGSQKLSEYLTRK